MNKNRALQDVGVQILCRGKLFPLLAFAKKGVHTECRTPLKIAVRIVSIA
jgi:hypothetical protein